MDEYKTVERPSYFGKRRDSILAGYDETYGVGNWRIMWEINGVVYDFDHAIELYEDAYYLFLLANPLILNELCAIASNVYDNAVTNVNSLGYKDQENDSNHYQDITMRRCVSRLGKRFHGKELVQVRTNSKHQLGRTLSPSEVPFHFPDYVVKPVKTGWWKPGSVEEFWQSCKILQAKDKQPRVNISKIIEQKRLNVD